MKLPEYEWVQFGKAPLRLVIGQMRFTIMPGFEQKSFIAGFQKAVRSEYPRASREPTVTYQLSLTGLSPSPGETLWRFSSRDNKWAVVVGESAITLEARGYTSMRGFRNRFRFLLETATKTLEIGDRLRLGLRYINEIRYPHAKNFAEWQTLLNPEFVGFEAADLLDGRVDHTLQEVQVVRTDGIISIRHGLLNGAIVMPLPPEQLISGQFYLIDLDYYDNTECDLDISKTLQQLQNYNDLMYRFFRWILSEKLYDYLEPIHAHKS